jgi:hypothetical protein
MAAAELTLVFTERFICRYIFRLCEDPQIQIIHEVHQLLLYYELKQCLLMVPSKF